MQLPQTKQQASSSSSPRHRGRVAVQLTINGAQYQVRFGTNNRLYLTKLNGSRAPEAQYELTWHPVVHCSCPAAANYPGPCKHLRALVAVMQQLAVWMEPTTAKLEKVGNKG